MIASPALLPSVRRCVGGSHGCVIRCIACGSPDRRVLFRRARVRAVVRGNTARQNRRRRDVSRLRSPHLLSPAHGRNVLGDARRRRADQTIRRRHHRAAAGRHTRAGHRARHAQDARDVDVPHAERWQVADEDLGGQRRRRARAFRLRLSRLRLAPLQPAAHGAAARHRHQRSRQRRAGRVLSRGAGRVEERAHGQRGPAGPHQRAHVRRRRAADISNRCRRIAPTGSRACATSTSAAH